MTLQGYQTNLQEYVKTLSSLGLTEADYRRLFENQLYREKVMAHVTADLKPEEDEVWAEHILVNDQATAIKVKNLLLQGQSWDALAKEYSQDTSNKDNGGDLGWFGRGVMDKAFEDAAFKLAVGQISDPVQTSYGWHIIRVLGHQVRPLTAAQFDQLKQQKFQDWLTQQESKDQVKRYDYWKDRVPTEPTLPASLSGLPGQ